MRTTVDLPDDVHRIARSIAHDTHRSLSDTVVMLIRRGLGETSSVHIGRSERSGLPTVSLGHPVTSDDVRALDDEE